VLSLGYLESGVLVCVISEARLYLVEFA
jgi:hypothetical protein